MSSVNLSSVNVASSGHQFQASKCCYDSKAQGCGEDVQQFVCHPIRSIAAVVGRQGWTKRASISSKPVLLQLEDSKTRPRYSATNLPSLCPEIKRMAWPTLVDAMLDRLQLKVGLCRYD